LQTTSDPSVVYLHHLHVMKIDGKPWQEQSTKKLILIKFKSYPAKLCRRAGSRSKLGRNFTVWRVSRSWPKCLGGDVIPVRPTTWGGLGKEAWISIQMLRVTACWPSCIHHQFRTQGRVKPFTKSKRSENETNAFRKLSPDREAGRWYCIFHYILKPRGEWKKKIQPSSLDPRPSGLDGFHFAKSF